MSRVRFGPFELDPGAGELRRGDRLVPLQPQPLKVLGLLAGRAGQLVLREEIQREVWTGNTFVDFDQGLNYCIRQIRAALQDDAAAPRFVQTVPRRGYRFVARVEPAEQRVMVAVLPFENLSGDPEQEYFSDGLTEEMISQLGRLNPRRLGVIARTSSMCYKHTDKSIAAIGGELGVSYVLEGSVRRSGGRVRVTAQLVQVADQAHLWAESFERAADDILALQQEIARAIAARIDVQLSPRERPRGSLPRLLDPRAYEAYLRGRFFWKMRSREALRASARCFADAIEREPGYAPAYAGLADVYLTQLDHNYLAPREAFALADRALLDALRLDNTLAEPHTSLGHLRLHQFDWTAALRQFTHAIGLNPGYDAAHYYYGNLLAACGRFEEAMEEADRARHLDPVAANTRQNRIFILYLARRYEEAIAQVREALAADPGYTAIFYYMGLIHERLGAYDRALEAFERVSKDPDNRGAAVLAAIGFTYARAGKRDAAVHVLDRLEELATRQYVPPYELALLNLAVGNRTDALAKLATAVDEYSSFAPFLNVDARLDDIRDDPDFRALVRRMHFPAA